MYDKMSDMECNLEFDLEYERRRHPRKVTQNELASELGWTRQTIIDIEMGRTRPTAENESVLRDAIRRLAAQHVNAAPSAASTGTARKDHVLP